jgi:hypothetical protein
MYEVIVTGLTIAGAICAAIAIVKLIKLNKRL